MKQLLFVAALASCAQSGATVCSFDPSLVCPPDTVCVQLTLPDENACVSPGAITACDGVDGRGACRLAVDEDGDGEPDVGRCYDGVCFAITCGNGRIDFEEGEVCDDRNGITGDGCSASCTSNETCGNEVIDPIVVDRPSEQCDEGDVLSFDGCSSVCRTEQVAWSPLQFVSVPEARQGHIGVYNARQRRFVVFGGSDDGQLFAKTFDDTLEFDGRGWQVVSPLFRPSARAFAAAAYDAARDRVVMFGGQTKTTQVNETWEWDGARWTPRTTSVAPSPRVRAVMAYDSRRGVSVLHGGAEGTGPLDDTWEWDGVTWTESAKDARPLALEEPAMAYDPKRGVIVLVGYSEPRREMLHYTYDGTAWTEHTPAARPSPRRGAALAFDATRDQLVLFGGGTTLDDDRLDDMWTWTGTTWEPVATGGAEGRRNTALVSVADRSPPTLWMFGGGGTFVGGNVSYLNDTLAWNPASGKWTQLTTGAPSIAEPPAAVLDPVRHVVVVHGRETWELDGSWRGPTTTPLLPILEHAMAYDAARARTVLFGGRRPDNSLTNDTWTWDGTAWTRQTPPAPLPVRRGAHALAYDANRAEVVLFGGDDSGTLLDDIHVWDGQVWTRRDPAVHPVARRGAAMAYDPIRKRVILFGGEDIHNNNPRAYADTWEWDGTAWTQVTTSVAPIARAFASFAWNPARKKLTLFGGVGEGGVLADTWEWDGAAWSPLDILAVPRARSDGALVSSPSGDGMHLIGGWLDVNRTVVTQEHDLLRWRSEVVERESCSGFLDGDGDALVGCADPSCWHLCGRCGDGTCDGDLETPRSCATDCGAAITPVCGDFVCDANEACSGDCPAGP